MFKRGFFSLIVLALLAACPADPPTSIEGWATHIPTLQTDKEIRKATSEFKSLTGAAMRDGTDFSAAIPVIIPLLAEHAIVRKEAAYVLGELRAKSAAQPLIDAIDYSAAVVDKDASRANGSIAKALGQIGVPAAVKPLLKLTRSRDQFTALEAVKALGGTKSKDAVEPLSDIATSSTTDPFISKNAVIALGEIGDPSALPALIKMLFIERRGVSFYRETSFAIFQLGDVAIDPLIEILAGRDKELMAWAEEQGVLEAALYAKTAQVLGDLGDLKATPVLLKRLRYESEYADMRLLPRMFAAEALGRIRSKKAVGAISALLDEEEPNARGTYVRALVMIGDRKAVPSLVRSATRGLHSYSARNESLWGLAKLGGAGSLKDFDRIVTSNSKMKTCTAWFEGDKAAIEKQCQKNIDKWQKSAQKHRVMLVAAAECKRNVDCWVGKLEDENGRVRERAAFELGRLGDEKALVPILSAIQEDDLKARFGMLHSLDTLLFGSNDKEPPQDAARKAVDRLDVILQDEKGKAQFVKINEDVKRLSLKIRRHLAGRAAPAEEG